MLLQFLANMLAESRAVPSGRDGNLELAAAYHRGSVEVAIAGIIDSVAQCARLPRFVINGAIDLLRIGGGDDQEISLRHARAILRCQMF